MNKQKSFADLIKSESESKKDRFKDALLFGWSEAKSDSSQDFVQSCQDFFNRTGFLTEKQVNALFEMDANRSWDNDGY
jgi:hypothetical protein